jgi:hypothetical protein
MMTFSNEPVTSSHEGNSNLMFVFIPWTSLCKTNALMTKRKGDTQYDTIRYDVVSRLVLIFDHSYIHTVPIEIESSLLKE